MMRQVLLILFLSPVLIFSQPSSSDSIIRTNPILLGEKLALFSKALNEQRVVNVYLPANYHPDSAASYPVIYLLDGGTDKDFIHTAGVIQFATFPWVDMMPQSILVGIENVDRRRDFTYPSQVDIDNKELPTSGHSAEFISYIAEELQPLIDSLYRCSGERMLIGQSLGGLLAAEVLYTQQELFSQYLIVSPSLWWDDGSLLDWELQLDNDISVFIAVGKEGEVMEQAARSLNERIVDVATNGNQVDFLYFGEQDHGNIMHLALYYGLQSFYPKDADQ